MNSFRRFIRDIKIPLREALLFLYKSSDKAKNRFLFMDFANLLDSYLQFSPLLMRGYVLTIDQYIQEKND
jgi:hypothetical protein